MWDFLTVPQQMAIMRFMALPLILDLNIMNMLEANRLWIYFVEWVCDRPGDVFCCLTVLI
jgi:hypothetical protein